MDLFQEAHTNFKRCEKKCLKDKISQKSIKLEEVWKKDEFCDYMNFREKNAMEEFDSDKYQRFLRLQKRQKLNLLETKEKV